MRTNRASSVTAMIAHSPMSVRTRPSEERTAAGARRVATAISDDLLELALGDDAQIEDSEPDHDGGHHHANGRAVAEATVDERLDVDLGCHDVGIEAGACAGGEPDIDEVVEGPEGRH